MNQNFFEELSRNFIESLPPGVKEMHQDVEKNIKAVLQSALSKMNLVTREEFDVQTSVLLRTREKVEALEARLALLEQGGIPAGCHASAPQTDQNASPASNTDEEDALTD
jgi:BMFP domain-containing protein YqiC